jgi:CDP-diacylglycerol---glycerol-3-phosphate 3-phosphatidyltransferase
MDLQYIASIEHGNMVYSFVRERMNLPNSLTTLRIFLIPLILVFYYVDIPGELFGTPLNFVVVAGIFAFASLTDLLDGYLARKLNLITTYGKFLDPLADKILVVSALLLLVESALVPAWIVAIIVAREFIVSGIRMMLSDKGFVHSAQLAGKIKAAVTMVAIVLLFITPLQELGLILIYVATMLTLWSGMDYLLQAKDVMFS